MTSTTQPTAVITGASKGLGWAIAFSLAARGWQLVVDARHVDGLAAGLPGATVVAGDVTSSAHRARLVDAVRAYGRLDLLVNNASYLGPSPLPSLADYPPAELRLVYETDVLAPIALTQELLPVLRSSRGTVVNVSSDAAVEAYPYWGGYGSAKAALDHATAVLATEEPELAVYAVDPGDMRTDMHQAAFPNEDISDRPRPESVVPAFLHLLDTRPPSGRYRAAELLGVPA